MKVQINFKFIKFQLLTLQLGNISSLQFAVLNNFGRSESCCKVLINVSSNIFKQKLFLGFLQLHRIGRVGLMCTWQFHTLRLFLFSYTH